MMRIAYILFFMFCILEAVADPARVPVIIKANDGLDACMSMGAVHGLSPNGDGFLAVKSGPGTSFTRIDKITEGTYVYLCDFKKTKSGSWHGVVYSNSKSDLEACEVSKQVNRNRPYKGKCKSGWVNDQWIEVVAG